VLALFFEFTRDWRLLLLGHHHETLHRRVLILLICKTICVECRCINATHCIFKGGCYILRRLYISKLRFLIRQFCYSPTLFWYYNRLVFTTTGHLFKIDTVIIIVQEMVGGASRIASAKLLNRFDSTWKCILIKLRVRLTLHLKEMSIKHRLFFVGELWLMSFGVMLVSYR